MPIGVFAKLLDSKSLAELLFPGTPKNLLEKLPKSLNEILKWEYLKLDIHKIAKSAASVLDGVKRRGNESGS
jgi:hypothetical protein